MASAYRSEVNGPAAPLAAPPQRGDHMTTLIRIALALCLLLSKPLVLPPLGPLLLADGLVVETLPLRPDLRRLVRPDPGDEFVEAVFGHDVG